MAQIPNIDIELLRGAAKRPGTGDVLSSGLAGFEKGVDLAGRIKDQKAKQKMLEMQIAKALAEAKAQQEAASRNQAVADELTGTSKQAMAPVTTMGFGPSDSPVIAKETKSFADAAPERMASALAMASPEKFQEKQIGAMFDTKPPKARNYTKIGETDNEIILADMEDPTKVFRVPAPGLKSPKGDEKAEKTLRAKESLSGVVEEVGQHFSDLAKAGGIVDVTKGSIENLKARLASSAPAQAAAGAVGSETQSIRNKIVMARPLLINFIRQASEMGARGLDSEKELEFYLQAATNPTRDVQANFAALARMDQAYGTGRYKAPTKAAADLEKKFKSLSKAELDKLQQNYDATTKKQLASGEPQPDSGVPKIGETWNGMKVTGVRRIK